MSSNIQNLKHVNQQLANIGANHARMDASGTVRNSTRTKMDRFIGRILGKIDSNHTNAMNQRTIDQLCRKIENTDTMGKKYADLFRGRAESVRVDGIPLSGRAFSAALSQTLADAEGEQEIHKGMDRLQAGLTEQFMSGTGQNTFESAVAELEQSFGLHPGQSRLAEKKDELAGKIEAKLAASVPQKTSAESIQTLNAEATASIGKQVIKEEFIKSYLDDNIDEIYQGMRSRDGLGEAEVNLDSFKEFMVNRTNRSAMNMTELNTSIRLNTRLFAQFVRDDYIKEHSEPFLALDDSPDSFLTEYSLVADMHSPVTITPDMLDQLRGRFKIRLQGMYGLPTVSNPVPQDLPPPHEIKKTRNEFIYQFFLGAQRIQRATPKELDPRVVRDAYLTVALPVPDHLHEAAFDLAVGVQAAVHNAIQSSTGSDFLKAAEMLATYHETILGSLENLDPDDRRACREFAFRTGVNQALKDVTTEELDAWVSGFDPSLEQIVKQAAFQVHSTKLAAEILVENILFTLQERTAR